MKNPLITNVRASFYRFLRNFTERKWKNCIDFETAYLKSLEYRIHRSRGNYMVCSIVRIKEGWIFRHQTVECIENRNLDKLVFGIGPMFVEQSTGKVYPCGSAFNEEDVILMIRKQRFSDRNRIINWISSKVCGEYRELTLDNGS
jgi:hypothetical protein